MVALISIRAFFTGYLCQILLVLVVASYLRLFGRFCCLVGKLWLYWFFNPYRRCLGLLLAFLVSGSMGSRWVRAVGGFLAEKEDEEMILDIVQTRKELREAEFKILRGDVNVGSAFLKGTLGSIDANVIVIYKENIITEME